MRDAKFTLSMARGSGVSLWSIRVKDEASGVILCDLDLTDAEMGAAIGSLVITGLPGRVAPPEALERVGKMREVDTIHVDISDLAMTGRGCLDDIRARAEATCAERGGGWMVADSLRVYNHHRVREDAYAVDIVRWVDAAEAEAGTGTEAEVGA